MVSILYRTKTVSGTEPDVWNMVERTKREAAPGAFLKTGELLEATGITHQVLYRYMTMRLIAEEKISETGQRVFNLRTVTAIRLIQRLNRSGYTLRDIKEIFFKEKRIKKPARVRKSKAR
jgi:hypothetical protein